MGHKHNRKRMRSRPRSRGSNSSTRYPIPIPGMVPSLGPNAANTFQPSNSSYATANAFSGSASFTLNAPATMSPCRPGHSDLKRQRMFGSDAGDVDGEMCGSMLQVVLDLFDGIDYEEP